MATPPWERVRELYHGALDRGPEERLAWLRDACGADFTLMAEVESLLARAEQVDQLEPPSSVTLSRVFGGGPQDAVGRRVGRYTIRGVLGRGGMAVVYQAEQDDPRRTVALKVMRALPYFDELTPRLLRRETQALARLDHPNIAAIYEAGQTDEGWHYFAMELVEGGPLTQFVREREYDLPAKLTLFQQICDAVHSAHQRGVIHRDLKPSNILVRYDGRPKVLDFGLARIITPDAGQSLFTETGSFRGTPAYASPEQARGSSADVRGDVYSLGVILYELLTSRLPYRVDGLSLAQVAHVICNEIPAAPSSVNHNGNSSDARPSRSVWYWPIIRRWRAQRRNGIREELDTIVLKCLAKEPERRYQSAEALSVDIGRHLAGEPIEARRDSVSYLIRKWFQRHRVAATVAALAGALVITSLAAGFQYRRAARSRELAEAQTRVSVLHAARIKPSELEEEGSQAAAVAAAVWKRVQSGDATAAERRALIEASLHFEFNESGIVDLSRHMVREGGFILNYTTTVYACPRGFGFLVTPSFVLDEEKLPPQGSYFRAETKRLPSAIHVSEMSGGQHRLSGALDVSTAHVVNQDENGDGEFAPLGSPMRILVGPFRFDADPGDRSDYATEYRRYPLIEHEMSASFKIVNARLAPTPARPRQSSEAKDELDIIVSFLPPPLDLAIQIELAPDRGDFTFTTPIAITSAAGDLTPTVAHSLLPASVLLHDDVCELTLRIPASLLLVWCNPDTLMNQPLVIRVSPSTEAVRSAGFDRFLVMDVEQETTVSDSRPKLRQQAAAIVYPRLEKHVSPSIVFESLEALTLEPALKDEAVAFVQELAKPTTLLNQAWWIATNPDSPPEAYERALVRAKEAAQKVPNDPDILRVLGMAQYRAGDYASAIDALKRALGDEDENLSVLAFLAMAEYCAAHRKAAGRWLELIKTRSSDSPAVSWEANRHIEEARQLVEQERPCK